MAMQDDLWKIATEMRKTADAIGGAAAQPLYAQADAIDVIGRGIRDAAAAPTPAPQPAPSPAPSPTPAPPAPTPPAPAPGPAPSPPAAGALKGATFVPAPTMKLLNPERGFYVWADQRLDNATQGSMNSIRSRGFTLGIGLMNIETARGKAIVPPALMTKFRNGFEYARKAGVKLVCRVVYNYKQGGEDDKIENVLKHIPQMMKLMRDNADVVAYVQGGFVGAWGEWHSSTNDLTSDANRAKIFAELAKGWPGKHIGLRYPTHAKALGWPEQVAVYVDCILAPQTDGGTYKSESDPLRAETAKQMDTRPFGGETCGGNEQGVRKSGADFLAYGKANHAVYVNNDFDTAFHKQWKADGKYDEIERSLGYRFELHSISHPATAKAGTAVEFLPMLSNVGWARIFSERKLMVTLKNRKSGTSYSNSGGDMRDVKPQGAGYYSPAVSFPIPTTAEPGEYDVLLSMPDPLNASDIRQSVRFANADKGQQKWLTSGHFQTGTTITIN